MSKPNRTAPGFFVLGMYADGPSLLTPTGTDARRGKTLADAKHSIWWQHQPRGECETEFRICKAHPTERGVFIDHATGERYTESNAFPMTQDAHAWTYSEIWGFEATGDEWRHLEAVAAAGPEGTDSESPVLDALTARGWLYIVPGTGGRRAVSYIGRRALESGDRGDG